MVDRYIDPYAYRHIDTDTMYICFMFQVLVYTDVVTADDYNFLPIVLGDYCTQPIIERVELHGLASSRAIGSRDGIVAVAAVVAGELGSADLCGDGMHSS